MALACIGVLEWVIPQVEAKAQRLWAGLEQAGFRVQGAGLLVGVDTAGVSTLDVSRRLLRSGWLALPAGEQAEVIALTPPLTITEAQIDAFVVALSAACEP